MIIIIANDGFTYVCMCMYVYVLKGESSKRIGDECNRGKVKELERSLSASVMKSPLALILCMGKHGHCVGLRKLG